MSLAKLQLEKYILKALEIRVNEMYDKDAKEPPGYKTNIGFEVLKSEEGLFFKVPFFFEMVAEKNLESCELKKLQISMDGFFSLENEDHLNLVPNNCVAMLYSLSRGIISTATANIPSGSFLIPTLNISEMTKSNKERKKDKD